MDACTDIGPGSYGPLSKTGAYWTINPIRQLAEAKPSKIRSYRYDSEKDKDWHDEHLGEIYFSSIMPGTDWTTLLKYTRIKDFERRNLDLHRTHLRVGSHDKQRTLNDVLTDPENNGWMDQSQWVITVQSKTPVIKHKRQIPFVEITLYEAPPEVLRRLKDLAFQHAADLFGLPDD